MTLQTNPCEGTDGTTVSVANSDDNGGTAFALVSLNGETCAYETTGAIHGTSSIRFSTALATNPCQVGWTDTGATSAVARWYEKWTTLPSALQQNGINFRGNSAATSLMRREVQTDGTFRIVMGATTSSFSGSAMSTGTTYRFEAVSTGFNGSSGATTVTCYVGESTSALTSVSVSGATTSFTCDAARFGKFNGAGNMDVLVDSPAANIGSSTTLGRFLASVNGVCTAAGSGSSVAVKVAVESGRAAAAGAGTSAATKRAVESGIAALALAGSATAKHVLIGSGVAAAAVTGSATAKRVAALSGIVAVVGLGDGYGVHVAPRSGVATAALSGTAALTVTAATTRGQASARGRAPSTGDDRTRVTATAAARERAVATASGR